MVFLGRDAKKLGYKIFEVDLKGVSEAKDLDRVMKYISQKFTRVIDELNSVALQCVFGELIKCPNIQQSWYEASLLLMQIVQYFMTATAIGIMPTVIYTWTMRHIGYKVAGCTIIIGFIICASFAMFVVNTGIAYNLSYLAHGFHTQIANGEWVTTFCCLNAVQKCDDHGPILVIRDVKNFPSNHLHKLFYLLQMKKYGDIDDSNIKANFPIVLETLDDLWMEGMLSDTANSAFTFYCLSSMDYSNGKVEMVQKYDLFDEKLYDSLYKVFGGHIRFYSYYWKRIKFASHDDIIGELRQESRIIFGSCLNSVFSFLRDAKELEASSVN